MYEPSGRRLGAGHPLFRTQYELESAEGGGRLFSPAQIAALEGIHARLRAPIEGERYVAGLDLAGEGANADTVVLTLARVLAREGGGHGCEVVEHVAWRSRPFGEVVAGCVAAARMWRCEALYGDATGMGAPIAAQLSDALGTRVRAVVFTAGEKSVMGYDMLAAAGTGRLSVYQADGSADSKRAGGSCVSARRSLHRVGICAGPPRVGATMTTSPAWRCACARRKAWGRHAWRWGGGRARDSNTMARNGLPRRWGFPVFLAGVARDGRFRCPVWRLAAILVMA